jgi:stress response protein YsnF
MPTVREEGDTIVIPIVEEVLVVERRLFLKEEVHVGRVTSTERHHKSVTLRHHDRAALEDRAAKRERLHERRLLRGSAHFGFMGFRALVGEQDDGGQ